jgi:phage shock protein E
VDWFSVYFKKIKTYHKKNKTMNNKKTIIDVRTIEEFDGGHLQDSINIPLHEIPHRISEIKKMEPPLILCCASGNRSGQAALYLKSIGIDCSNGGSWLDVSFN